MSALRLSYLSNATLERLLERERYLELDVSTKSVDNQIQGDLDQLRDGIDDLAKEYRTLEAAGEMGVDDLRQKKDVLDKLRKQNDRLNRLFRGDKSNGAAGATLDQAEQGFAPYRDEPEDGAMQLTDAERDRADLLGLPSTGLPRTKQQGHVKLKDGREVDATKIDNPDVMALQQQMMKDQDTDLDFLSLAVSRQNALAMQINQELTLHSDLLDDTAMALDSTDDNLVRARTRLDTFRHRIKSDGWSCGLIGVIIIVLFVLVIVIKL